MIAQAGDVLGGTFVDGPVWIWTFPDPEVRAKAVDFLERRVLRAHVPFGHCWATMDAVGRRVLAAAAWRPPRRQPGMLVFIRHGLARVPFIVGVEAFRRMMHAGGTMRAIRREYSPEDHPPGSSTPSGWRGTRRVEAWVPIA